MALGFDQQRAARQREQFARSGGVSAFVVGLANGLREHALAAEQGVDEAGLADSGRAEPISAIAPAGCK